MSRSGRWVVVGAGSAGCVVAARLSEDADRQVTLLDVGPDLSPGIVPAAVDGSNFLDALAAPGRTHDRLLATRSVGSEPTAYLRGRGVGGSSVVNAMVALPGSDALYRSWGWHDTAAAFERVQIPAVVAGDDELGAVDRALLAADADAERARLTRRSNSGDRTSHGRRVTSAEAYLWPVRGRSNLDVCHDSDVWCVRFDGRRTVGVTLRDGTEIDADHVVICAGAIHTPAILLRSAVDTQGIGTGLQDHPSAPFTLELCDGVAQDFDGLALATLLHRRIGDDTIQLLPMNHLGRGTDEAGLGLLMAALMTPNGRAGTVTIDDDGEPIVDFALLSDERDLAALAGGVGVAIEVLGHPAFTEIVDRVYIDEHGTTIDALVDDAAIAAWLPGHCGDYVHASSSCAMGTVVDRRGAVRGYEELFVCDASIFPTIPDANTHLPTTMAAERLCLPGRMIT